jgi:hypothetical protein
MVPPILPGYRLEELASEVDADPLLESAQGPSQLRLCRPE